MNCERMENKILGYLDGRLKEGERAELEKHLEECAPCRVRVHEFRAVSGLLDELPQIAPSPAFDARVHALVEAEPEKQSWWAWMTPSPRVAFAASMLLIAMVWIGSQTVKPGGSGSNSGVTIAAEDIPVLENYDVLSNFEPLTDLPQPVQAEETNQ